MSHHPTRRQVIQRSVAVGLAPALFHIVPRHVMGGPNDTPPSEKLNVAGIGVGGMGFNNLRNMSSANIVAICDVDLNYAGKAIRKFPQARTWKDYRVMLEKQKDIEAVLIATPDHTHAVISAAAMRAGKHVYCQKPLTHDVYEARVLAQLAKQTGVTTQMGTQYTSSEGIRMVCEWIWSGAIGKVREVDAWCTLKYTPFGHAYWSTLMGERPTEKPPVPEGLDWDTWIGPAPYRPYHKTYHPQRWRAWWDFGNGMMGDRGAHTLDSAFWALELDAPSRIELVRTEGGNKEIHPDVAHVKFHFDARGDMPPVVVNWYEGMAPPNRPAELPKERRLGDPGGGAIFKGENGIIMHGVYPDGPRIWPEARLKEVGKPPRKLERVNMSHEEHWVRCSMAGKKASSDFSYSGPLTEFALLGNVAIRLGGTIKWDAKNLKATGHPEADRWIRRPYRDGWSLDADTMKIADGFVPMFNGKDLSGWKTTGNWLVEGDTVTLKPRPGEHGWQRFKDYITTTRKYANFIIDLEFKFEPRGNSGVFMRIDDPNNPVDSGFEVQILDTYGKKNVGHHDCGGVIRTVGPAKNMVKPAGQWNRYTITMNGNQLTVVLNGEQIVDIDISKTPLKNRPARGHIGFQDEAKRIWYRNVRIKELP